MKGKNRTERALDIGSPQQWKRGDRVQRARWRKEDRDKARREKKATKPPR